MSTDTKCLIIVGMHRSGTSLLTSILKHAGLFVGDDLLGPGEDNKKGYFENTDFYQFHRDVLTHPDGWDLKALSILSDEQDRIATELIGKNTRPEWGWKDPRTALMLDYWEKKIPNAYFLFVYRNPWDVVDSLFRRGSDHEIVENPSFAFHAWEFYNREIITKYNECKEKSILVSIEDVLKDTRAFICLINTRFGFSLKSDNVSELFDVTLLKDSELNCFRSFYTASAFPEVIMTLNELRELSGKQGYDFDDLLSMKKSSLFFKKAIDDWFYSAYSKLKIKNLLIKNDKLKEHVEENQKIANMYIELNKNMENLKDTLIHMQNEIDWMKETKFWKLRNIWQTMKKIV